MLKDSGFSIIKGLVFQKCELGGTNAEGVLINKLTNPARRSSINGLVISNSTITSSVADTYIVSKLLATEYDCEDIVIGTNCTTLPLTTGERLGVIGSEIKVENLSGFDPEVWSTDSEGKITLKLKQ